MPLLGLTCTISEETLVREERFGSEPGGAHFLPKSRYNHSLQFIPNQHSLFFLYRIATIRFTYRIVSPTYTYVIVHTFAYGNLYRNHISTMYLTHHHELYIYLNNRYMPSASHVTATFDQLFLYTNRVSCTSTPSNHTAQQQSRLPLFYLLGRLIDCHLERRVTSHTEITDPTLLEVEYTKVEVEECGRFLKRRQQTHLPTTQN